MSTLKPRCILCVPLCLAILTFAILIGVLGSRPQVALAQPRRDEVNGNITTPTTWTLANSPYTMTGDVIVNALKCLLSVVGVKEKPRKISDGGSLNLDQQRERTVEGVFHPGGAPLISKHLFENPQGVTDRRLLGNPLGDSQEVKPHRISCIS